MIWTKKAVLVLVPLGLVAVGSVALTWGQAQGGIGPMETPTVVAHQTETPDIPDSVRAAIEKVEQFGLYPDWADGQWDEPFLVCDRDGRPAYWKMLLRRDGYIIGFIDVSVETGTVMRFGEFGKPLQHFPDPPTAEEALERAQGFLSRYADATIDRPFFYERESWLILVRRNGEIVARVGVWGNEVWDEDQPLER